MRLCVRRILEVITGRERGWNKDQTNEHRAVSYLTDVNGKLWFLGKCFIARWDGEEGILQSSRLLSTRILAWKRSVPNGIETMNAQRILIESIRAMERAIHNHKTGLKQMNQRKRAVCCNEVLIKPLLTHLHHTIVRCIVIQIFQILPTGFQKYCHKSHKLSN